MQKEIVKLAAIKLVGITTRTNNASLFESNPETNKVAATVQKYFHNQLGEKIQDRKHPGKTFCVYTNYESDFTGDYTYFIGEEVSSLENLSDGFDTITIPQQTYTKLTNQSGPMPTVCIDMWKAIWSMKPFDLGGERNYIADFEIYDERSRDHQNVVLDIYVGVKHIS